MSWLSAGLKKAENWIANKIPHTSEADKRQAMQAAKEQIDYYQQAKAQLTEQKNENESQKKMERTKINEKEIRARQRQYKRGGFLEAPSAAPKETLG